MTTLPPASGAGKGKSAPKSTPNAARDNEPKSVDPPLKELVENLTPDTEQAERIRILGRIVDEVREATERELLLKLASRRMKITLGAVKSSANAAAEEIRARREIEAAQPLSAEQQIAAKKKRRSEMSAKIETILDNALSTITLRAQSDLGGELGYIVPFAEAGSLFVRTSGVTPVTDLHARYRVVEPPPDSSPMSAEGIRRFQNGDGVDPSVLFKRLKTFIRLRVVFPHECTSTMLALWVMGTYCYILFNYFGYVWLTSLGPVCAKSLVAEILSKLAFNATGLLVDSTAATVFREIDANGATLILDEFENADAETKGAILSMLHAGFQKDAKVPRMTPKGDGWTVTRFHVYSPKVIAGINQIPRPLQTRAFRIEMPKKKVSEEIKRFHPGRNTEWAVDRRDDMAIFALNNAKSITDLYDRRDELVPKQSPDGRTIYDDRLRDIFAPLFVMAALVDEHAGETLATPELDRLLQIQAGARDSEGPGDYVLAAHALWNWATGRWTNGKVVVKTDQAKEIFAAAEIGWAAFDSAKAQSLLRKLGGQNDLIWWEGKTNRGYVFIKKELQDLVERNPISTRR